MATFDYLWLGILFGVPVGAVLMAAALLAIFKFQKRLGKKRSSGKNTGMVKP